MNGCFLIQVVRCVLIVVLVALPTWRTQATGGLVPGSFQRSDSSVEASLREATPPWYDPKTDKVRTLSDFQTVFQLQEGTSSGERATAARDFSTTLTTLWDWVVDLFSGWGAYLPTNWFPTMHWFWWLVFIVALIIIAVVLYYVLQLDAIRQFTGLGRVASKKKKRKAATIEDLPFELEGEALSLNNLLQRARTAQQKGDLRLAIIYLFSHLLLTMDKKELITLRKGKTNRVYAAEVKKTDSNVLPLYNSVMNAFERCFFGHHPLHGAEVETLLNETESWA